MPMPPAIYIGWIGYANLGDEAMFEVCQKRFADLRWVSFEGWDAKPEVTAFVRRASYDPRVLLRSLADEVRTLRRLRGMLTAPRRPVGAMLGGGTLINATDEFLGVYTRAKQRFGRPIPIFSCGVKTADFWSGKGDWKDRTRDWVAAMSDLPQVGVRGPLSQQCLESAGARNVAITGDPAVWLHRPLGSSPPLSPDRPFRIAINCGVPEHLWGDLQTVQEEFATLVKKLAGAGHQVTLFAISPADLPACVEVARRAHVGVTPPPEALTTYDSFTRGMSGVDLVVAFKLHAGVLAACANVPFVMVEYQPKCRDFCASIGWDEYNVRSDRAQGEALFTMVTSMLRDGGSLRSKLCTRLCQLRTEFENYCGKLIPLIAP